MWRGIHFFLIGLFVTGCAAYARYNLDDQFGRADPSNRKSLTAQSSINYWRDVNPILEHRCVTCHSCYDSPCQLTLSSPSGLERGAHKEKVYAGARIVAAQLTRLLSDGNSVTDWRNKGFSPVLNERHQTAEANIKSSVLAQMLMLKHRNPVLSQQDISDNFEFSLTRNQQCPNIEEFDKYAKDHPLWGMPYGLPAIADDEYNTLINWIREGAVYSTPEPLGTSYQQNIQQWEEFLNGDSFKQQLMSRYLFEHLFTSNVFFGKLSHRQYFRLLRSKTPPGQVIQKIATRRPYDDPGVGRVYYRLLPLRQTIVAKTHMPYALSPVRMQRFKELFLADNYKVNQLPSYKADIASNPFLVFADIPVQSRYRFLLDEAQNTIMNFIKGSVCRGQLALSVIQDHFWIFFVEPDNTVVENSNDFLNQVAPSLRLPSEKESTALNPLTWLEYSKLQKKYRADKIRFLNETLSEQKDISLDLVWTGDGWNDNAALTVFRHFDSASVIKGLVGKEPKTAWLVSYSLLERIHYLLVAGYDVYGNVGHQLYTRFYMDFLRMDGEFNFLALLPLSVRAQERDHWYEATDGGIKDYISEQNGKFYRESGISYVTDNPKQELFDKLKHHLGSVLNTELSIEHSVNTSAAQLQQLNSLVGEKVTFLPETSILIVGNVNNKNAPPSLFTLLHNVARKNVSHLLLDNNTLLPQQDYLSVVPGVVGAYPNVLFKADVTELEEFVTAINNIKVKQDFYSLKQRFAISRSNPEFWQQSDQLLAAYKQIAPLRWGILDYSRLDHHNAHQLD